LHATRAEWDPVSKEPIYKVTTVRVPKVGSTDHPYPAPTTTPSAPITEIRRETKGGSDALVRSTSADGPA
jgi:hypothetical protein